MAKVEIRLMRIFRNDRWIYGKDVPADQWFDTYAEYYPTAHIEVRGIGGSTLVRPGRTIGVLRIYDLIRPCESVEEADRFLERHFVRHVNEEVTITPRE